jgi:uncharacterized RDD family membrane protein YckC
MNCPHCNHPNLDDAHFCARCGQDIVSPSAPEPAVHDFTAPPAAPQELLQHIEYAGFGLRLVAVIIDNFILVAIHILPMSIASDNPVFRFVVSPLICWLYFALMESSLKQATLGKMAVGIAVTDLENNRISFPRATGRHFASYISAIILGIGFIMIAFTEKKQGLHDILADTLVVKR